VRDPPRAAGAASSIAAIRLPSGDHAKLATERGLVVRRRSPPPRVSVTTMPTPALPRTIQAIALPPGDHRGFCSRSGNAVVLPVARSTRW
jgi:hypothetical protein